MWTTLEVILAVSLMSLLAGLLGARMATIALHETIFKRGLSRGAAAVLSHFEKNIPEDQFLDILKGGVIHEE
jgi:hypothetical protein